MKNDLIPLTSLALFLWSAWAFYSGDHELAYYLLGASIYVVLIIGVTYLFSIDSLIDLVEKGIKHQTNENERNNEALLMRLSALMDKFKK